MAEYEAHQLAVGTVLDDRYEIQEVLGEGGFGITYAGLNRRVNVKVAIKEFFWKDYVTRDCRDTDQIRLKREEDRERFEKEKDKFLKEARIVGDFINEPGVVDVTDYFEANGTGYIVMGYLDGTTLKDCLKKQTRFEAEEIFRTMIPLMETLGKIHDCEVIHRDISPDNIMLMKDGTLKLIDFGAARDYSASMERSYSVVLKGGYTPREQYDSKGKQGPWTDIYALCATIYHCITGVTPDDSLQRILHDELKSPSELGIQIEAKYEKIIMKGLSLSVEGRYQKMSELIAAIKEALPEEKPAANPVNTKKAVIIGICAAAVCILAVLGIWYVQTHQAEIKFRGIRTETVVLTPPDEMSTKEFYKTAEYVKERFAVFAGEDNYIWEEKDGIIKVITPLDIYGDEEIYYVLNAYLTSPWKMYFRNRNEDYSIRYQEEFTEEDIVAVDIKEGEVDGVERADYELPEEGDYSYLEMKLSDRISDLLEDDLQIKGKKIALCFDVNEKGEYMYEYSVVSKGDGNTIYIIDKTQRDNFDQLIQHNMMQGSFEQRFDFDYDIAVDWEDPSHSLIAGENQCDPDDIKGESIVTRYTTYSTEEGKGAWYNVLAVFKERMDSMGIPYAFGIGYSDQRSIVIKTAQKDVCGVVVDNLPISGYDFNEESKWKALLKESALGIEEITAEEQGNGKYALKIQFAEYCIEDITTGTQAMLDQGEHTLYLSLGGYKLAEKEITVPITDGCITFTNLCFSDHKELDDETMPIVEFMKSILVESDMPISYKISEYCLLSEEGEVAEDQSDFGFYATADKTKADDLREKVEEAGGTLEMNISTSGEEYSISFTDYPLDDTPEVFFEWFQKFYEENQLGDGECNQINVMVTIKKSDEDEAKHRFSKYFYFTITEAYDKPKMYLFGTIATRGDEKLKKQCETYFQKNVFYKNLIKEEGSLDIL
ncbi:MAG: serine/threonine protein kinase [Clostridia bacterium]|nr:serine/threonine protein kinase [Clostridia bacterium]